MVGMIGKPARPAPRVPHPSPLVEAAVAKEAFALASAKLPFKTIVVHRMLG